jgi:hypothetical protein
MPMSKIAPTPLPCDAQADVRLVLVVGTQHLDGPAVHRAAEILHRHGDRSDGAIAGIVGHDGGQVGEHADADRPGTLRPQWRDRHRGQRSRTTQHAAPGKPEAVRRSVRVSHDRDPP